MKTLPSPNTVYLVRPLSSPKFSPYSENFGYAEPLYTKVERFEEMLDISKMQNLLS